MSDIYIHSPSCALARVVRCCPTCKSKRRMIARVYGYYATIFVCGGCGCKFGEEGRVSESKSRRMGNRGWVRKMWPKAFSFKEALSAIFS